METVLSYRHLIEDEKEWELPPIGLFFMSTSDSSYFYSIPFEQILLVRTSQISQLFQCWYDRMSTKQPPLLGHYRLGYIREVMPTYDSTHIPILTQSILSPNSLHMLLLELFHIGRGMPGSVRVA
ncbi:hypothetical protein WA538_000700 [Blastocystis sp. DL]